MRCTRPNSLEGINLSLLLKMENKNLNLNILSDVAFLIPIFFVFHYGFYWYSPLIVLTMAFSLLFHFNREKKFERIDNLFAVLLIVGNITLLTLSGFAVSYTVAALFFVVLGFLFFFKAKKSKTHYEIYHSLWHLASVVITLLCVLAYGGVL